jgi:TonB family protein
VFTVLLMAATAVSANFDGIAKHEYPQAAMRKGQEGFVLKKLTITPEGTLDRCEIVHSSGHRMLDEAACNAMKTARFTSAKDRSGTPVYGVLRTLSSYALNSRSRVPLASEVELKLNRFPAGVKDKIPVSTLSVVVDEQGNVESCDVDKTSGASQLDVLACSAGLPAAAITPAVNSRGAGVRSVQTIEIRFALESAPTRTGLATP